MSIQGRRFIDVIKKFFPRIAFPVPPYASSEYWERVYSELNESDCHEWANVSFMDLAAPKSYPIVFTNRTDGSNRGGGGLLESLKLSHPGSKTGVDGIITILNIGCGNSNFGFELHNYLKNMGLKNEMIQTDVSESLINSMQTRYQNTCPDMKFERSDAINLPYRDLDVVVDKGLIDAMFCSNPEKIIPIFKSVHTSLRTNGVFVFFSLSHPEYIMDGIRKFSDESKRGYQKYPIQDWINNWNIEVRKHEKIYMYNLTKSTESSTEESLPTMYKTIRR